MGAWQKLLNPNDGELAKEYLELKMRLVWFQPLPQFTIQVFLLVMMRTPFLPTDHFAIFSIILSFLNFSHSVLSYFLGVHLEDKVTYKHSLRLLAVEFASVLSQPHLLFISIFVSQYSLVPYFVYVAHLIASILAMNVHSRTGSIPYCP